MKKPLMHCTKIVATIGLASDSPDMIRKMLLAGMNVARLKEKGAEIPVLAKLEKPQAIAKLEAITDECDAIMIARGDLGVEMSPEKVPLIQKRIIETLRLPVTKSWSWGEFPLV